MASGSGAHVVHSRLAEHLPHYHLCSYSPKWTLFPPALYTLCQHSKVDLVHTVPDYGIFFKQKRTPLVVTFHNYVLDRFMREYSSILQNIHYQTDLKWFTLNTLAHAQQVTAVSHFTANLVSQDLNYQKTIRVIYNGIDEKRFFPVATVEKKEILVLFSGNLHRRKGIFLLPEIARFLHPNITILYTRGLRTNHSLPACERLREVGMVAYRDMPTLYQKADILLMPTVREGFGLAVAEAMACGLPVVATNCSAIPELVDEGKGGFLCELGDAKAFADKINLLATSPNLRRDMGAYNRVKVEQCFTETRMIREYQLLFEEMMDIHCSNL